MEIIDIQRLVERMKTLEEARSNQNSKKKGFSLPSASTDSLAGNGTNQTVNYVVTLIPPAKLDWSVVVIPQENGSIALPGASEGFESRPKNTLLKWMLTQFLCSREPVAYYFPTEAALEEKMAELKETDREGIELAELTIGVMFRDCFFSLRSLETTIHAAHYSLDRFNEDFSRKHQDQLNVPVAFVCVGEKPLPTETFLIEDCFNESKLAAPHGSSLLSAILEACQQDFSLLNNMFLRGQLEKIEKTVLEAGHSLGLFPQTNHRRGISMSTAFWGNRLMEKLNGAAPRSLPFSDSDSDDDDLTSHSYDANGAGIDFESSRASGVSSPIPIGGFSSK